MAGPSAARLARPLARSLAGRRLAGALRDSLETREAAWRALARRRVIDSQLLLFACDGRILAKVEGGAGGKRRHLRKLTPEMMKLNPAQLSSERAGERRRANQLFFGQREIAPPAGRPLFNSLMRN